MPKYLDLFAGAGGLSDGFPRAGYEPVAHVEMDKAACFTDENQQCHSQRRLENASSKLLHRHTNTFLACFPT